MQNTEVYKKRVINMGTKVYNNLPPRFLKEIDDYRAFKRKLKKFFSFSLFNRWKNLYPLSI
jgi:rRNA maturation protein Nop10